MERRALWTIFLLLALLVAAWRAAPQGDGPRPGEASGAPCPPLPPPTGTIVNVATAAELQDAVANAADDTTILIAPGTYDLTQTLVFADAHGVTLRGGGDQRTDVVLRGRGMSNPNYGNVPHGILVQDADDLLIADLTIRDAYFHNIQIQGEQGPQRIRLYNLHLLDAGEQIVKVSTAGPPGPYADDGEVACSLIEYTDRARSWYTNGVDALAVAGWTIRDNLFRRIRAPQGQLAGPAVLFWRNSLDTVVERNLFVECDRAIALGLSAPDANSRDGETTYDHQGGVIRNNMVWQPAGAPIADVGITVNYANDFAIHHNTVLLNDAFPWAIEYRFSVTHGVLFNNLTDGPIQPRDGAAATLGGNVTDAQSGWFVNAPAGDLHLLPTAAAAIDQAAPLPAVNDDYDGDLRPAGPASDVGADEYGGAPFEPSAWAYLPALRRE